MTGTIRSLMAEKGYGFIKAGDGREFFFHQSALKNVKFTELTIGRQVTFEVGEGQKGPRAEDIYA